MTNRSKIAVYGATGFTGKLVVRELAQKWAKSGGEIVVAGRTQAKLDAIAREARKIGEATVQVRQASIDDEASLDAMLEGVGVLINCAGPFSDLGLGVVAAAVRNGVHYFDTTGEQVFMRRARQGFDAKARAQGVAIAPATAYEFAVGVMAARLAVQAGAQRLGICYAQRNMGMSHGTMKSVIRALEGPAYTFVDGELTKARVAYRRFEVPRHGRAALNAVWIPGGESIQVPLFARHIQQVETCVAVGAQASKWMKHGLPLVKPALGFARPIIDRLIERASGDPHKDRPAPMSASDAGEVEGPMSAGDQQPEFFVTAFDPEDGRYFVGIAGGDPYLVTAKIIVEAARRTLADGPEEVGFTSVGGLFDARDFLAALGLEVVDL